MSSCDTKNEHGSIKCVYVCILSRLCIHCIIIIFLLDVLLQDDFYHQDSHVHKQFPIPNFLRFCFQHFIYNVFQTPNIWDFVITFFCIQILQYFCFRLFFIIFVSYFLFPEFQVFFFREKANNAKYRILISRNFIKPKSGTSRIYEYGFIEAWWRITEHQEFMPISKKVKYDDTLWIIPHHKELISGNDARYGYPKTRFRD